MTTKFKAACVQNCATADVDENIEICTRLTRQAAAEGAKLIALPEYFSGLEVIDRMIHPVAFPEGNHPVVAAFTALARELDVYLLLGSLGITSADGRIFNRGYLIDNGGNIAARYNKIHMFDVDLGEGKKVEESATIAPGDEAVIADVEGAALGMSICYDIRFAHLYRTLAQGGASILAAPAAFTKLTGEAHWHVLQRARAIENGCYVISPCQYGTLKGGAECYGHSVIIDPWGKVLADGGEGEGIIAADIDLNEVSLARQRIPSLQHDRPYAFDNPAPATQ